MLYPLKTVHCEIKVLVVSDNCEEIAGFPCNSLISPLEMWRPRLASKALAPNQTDSHEGAIHLFQTGCGLGVRWQQRGPLWEAKGQLCVKVRDEYRRDFGMLTGHPQPSAITFSWLFVTAFSALSRHYILFHALKRLPGLGNLITARIAPVQLVWRPFNQLCTKELWK